MTIADIKTEFKKYSAYQDSGVEWLGKIPESWKAIKMKYLFRDVSIKNKPEETLLSVTQDKGVIPREWVENRMVMPSGSLETFKFIEKGDFSISLRSFEGGLEYCHHDGIISPAYTVLKKDKNLRAEYYKYLFKSKSFISEIQTSIVGIREGKNISYPILSYSLMPVPPIKEQTAIANFLDDKTALIDKAIAQKEKLIALLKERKQILIQNAVTKGLDKNAKMKDSGVEWIGEIPEVWTTITKLKYISSLKGRLGWQGLKAEEYIDEGPYIVSSAHFDGYDINWEKCPHVSHERYVMDSNIHLKEDDILVMKDGAKMGKLAFVGKLPDLACLNSHLLILRPFIKNQEEAYYPKYLFFYFQTDRFQDYVKVKGTGTTFLGISQESIGNFPVCLPSYVEQKRIVKHIETQSTKIDKAISLQEKQIDKLKEYKSVLIDSVVTGKVKVC